MATNDKLPDDADKVLRSVDGSAILNTLQSMKETGKKEELFNALNTYKNDNLFRLKVLEQINEMDYENEIGFLTDLLEKENYIYPGGSEAIIHRLMKERIVEMLEKKTGGENLVKDVDNYDQVKKLVSVVKEKFRR